MWLNLYATRLILKNLGVEDMGVYGVVGSIISLVGVFTGGITNAIQRFITFELGKDRGEANKVFCSSLNVIFILSFIVLVILELGGVWMLYHKVSIPEKSMTAAFWVFQLSIMTCIVNLVSIPYNALIIAHEKMDAFAFISVLQVVLSWVSAYFLVFFSENRLLLYGIFMAASSVLIRAIYQIYCKIKFEESAYHLYFDKSMILEISKFTGISSVSNGLQIISTQGLIFVINWIFGVAVNAVFTIATQLKNSIMSFGMNILKALSPQIIKSYANENFELHKKLVYSGSKMEAFMVYFIMIPFMFKTDYIMHLWLGTVPKYTVAFVQCTIFTSLVYSLFEPIKTSVLASNNIAKFMIVPDSLYLVVLPLCYFIGKFIGDAVLMILATVIIDFLICLLRTYYAIKVTPLRVSEMMREIVFPCILTGVIGFAIGWLLNHFFSNNLLNLGLYLFTNSTVLALVIYSCGLNLYERNMINSVLSKIKIYLVK